MLNFLYKEAYEYPGSDMDNAVESDIIDDVFESGEWRKCMTWGQEKPEHLIKLDYSKPGPQIIFHAKVCIIADHFQLASLTEFAVRNFEAIAEIHWQKEEFSKYSTCW